MAAENGGQQPQGKTKMKVAKTKKGKRFLESKAPKLVENPKKLLIIPGPKTSQMTKDVLTDIGRLKVREREDEFRWRRRHTTSLTLATPPTLGMEPGPGLQEVYAQQRDPAV